MSNITHITRWLRIVALLSGIFLLAAIISCEKSDDMVDMYQYYPLEAGKYYIYEVRQDIYSTGQDEPVVRTWQERDRVENATTNAEGIVTYTFSRSTRNTSGDYWQKVKEFTVQRYPDKILTNIDNQTYFSLAFPITENLQWNGNSYNNLDPEPYHYEGFNEPLTIGNQSFSKSLTVVERSDTSLINKYYGIKQYALGIGLIVDDQITYEFCQSEDCIGSGKIESGSRTTRRILEYGDK
jgi:hypothetical protein